MKRRRSATNSDWRRKRVARENGTDGKKGNQAPDASPLQRDGGDGGDFLRPQSRTNHPDARVACGCPARVGSHERASAIPERLAAKSGRRSKRRLKRLEVRRQKSEVEERPASQIDGGIEADAERGMWSAERRRAGTRRSTSRPWTVSCPCEIHYLQRGAREPGQHDQSSLRRSGADRDYAKSRSGSGDVVTGRVRIAARDSLLTSLACEREASYRGG
jgi:hypothetical protein